MKQRPWWCVIIREVEQALCYPVSFIRNITGDLLSAGYCNKKRELGIASVRLPGRLYVFQGTYTI